MPFATTGTIKYLAFASFSRAGLPHAVLTRRGGLSAPPWGSLNMSYMVGDDENHVLENNRRAFRALARPPESVFNIVQVHGREVALVTAPPEPGATPPQADAVLTDNPAVTLLLRFADCVPILFHDPRQKVVGLAHAGWRGTVNRVAAAVVGQMEAAYGSRPADILAAIGPSICARHYQVGPEVIAQVEQAFKGEAGAVLSSANGGAKFDLWRANEIVLRQAGVEHVETAGICTACHVEDWFSHRAEKGKTGRFGALIGLADNGHSTRN